MDTKTFQPELDKIIALDALIKKASHLFYEKPENKKKYKFKSIKKIEGSVGFFEIEIRYGFWETYILDIDLEPIEILAFRKSSIIVTLFSNLLAGTLKVLHDFLVSIQKTKLGV